MNKNKQHKISDLSSHLFWDVDALKLNWSKDDTFIVQRVLEYGLDKDWQILRMVYEKDKIALITQSLTYLSPKALSFISTFLNVNVKLFKCYTKRPLNHGHWIY